MESNFGGTLPLNHANTVERSLSAQPSLSPSVETCVEVVRSSRQYLIISEDVFNANITTMYHNAARHCKSEFPLYVLYNTISFCSTVAVQSAFGPKYACVATYPQALFDYEVKPLSNLSSDHRTPTPILDQTPSNSNTPSSTFFGLPPSSYSTSSEAPPTTSSVPSTPGLNTPTTQAPTTPLISAHPQSQSRGSPTHLFGTPRNTPSRLLTGAFDFTFAFAISNSPQSTVMRGDGDDVVVDAVSAEPGGPVHEEYEERADVSDDKSAKDIDREEVVDEEDEDDEGEDEDEDEDENKKDDEKVDVPIVVECMLSPGVKLTTTSRRRLPDFARVIIRNPYPHSAPGRGTSSTQDGSTLADSWEVKGLNTPHDWLSPPAAKVAERLVKSHMPQVYDMVQAAFRSNPEWNTVTVLLLIGPYFSQFIWSRSQLPEDLPASKPDVEPRQSTPPTPAPREEPVTPPTRQERLRTYANAISWLEEMRQEIQNRALPVVPYLNQPVFVRRGENGGVALSDSFQNALAHAWTKFDGQLEHQASWFKTEAEEISQDQLDFNIRYVGSWLRADEEEAINDVLNALDPGRKADSAAAAPGERTPTSGGTATTTSSDSNSSGSLYVPSGDASAGHVRVPQFHFPDNGSPSNRESRQAQGVRMRMRDTIHPVQPRAAPLPIIGSQIRARPQRQRKRYIISYKHVIEVVPDAL